MTEINEADSGGIGTENSRDAFYEFHQLFCRPLYGLRGQFFGFSFRVFSFSISKNYQLH